MTTKLFKFLVSVLLVISLSTPIPVYATETDDFNQNLLPITTENWGGNGATVTDNNISFPTGIYSEGSGSTDLTNPDLLAGIQTENAVLDASVDFNVSNLLELNPITIKIEIGLGSTENEAIENITYSSEQEITADGSYTLSIENQPIPANTAGIFINVICDSSTNGQVIVEATNALFTVDDTELPLISAKYVNEWTTGNIPVEITTSDNIGIKGIYDADGTLLSTGDSYSYTVSTEENSQRSFYTLDYAGNQSLTINVLIDKIDRTAPSMISEPTYNSEWTTEPVTVTFPVLTDDGGSPLSYALSTDNGNSYVTFSGNTYTIETEGADLQTYFRIEDASGNCSSNQVITTTNIDTADPVISGIVIDNQTGQTNISFNAEDTLSGISTVKYAAGTQDESYFADNGTLLADNDGYSFSSTVSSAFTIYAEDTAGNKTTYLLDAQNILPSISDIPDIQMSEDTQYQIEVTVSDDTTSLDNMGINLVLSDDTLLKEPVITRHDGYITIDLISEDNANTGSGYISATLECTD